MGHFPQKSPIISGSFAERDLQLNVSDASSGSSRLKSNARTIWKALAVSIWIAVRIWMAGSIWMTGCIWEEPAGCIWEEPAVCIWIALAYVYGWLYVYGKR